MCIRDRINPRFQRFDCKVFLTDAVRYMGGVVAVSYTHLDVYKRQVQQCMIDLALLSFVPQTGGQFLHQSIVLIGGLQQ